MTVGPLTFRQILTLCQVLVVAVALALASRVIPSLLADTNPGARPEAAVPILWVIVGLHLLLAFGLLIAAMRLGTRSMLSTSVLVASGLVSLLFGVALADAGSAYWLEGPSMLAGSVTLFVCAAADFLCGATVITVAFFRPKRS